ncbi:protease inhibitor I42 family protein [Brevibacillus sp. GCM10020057]|uniref:protease inhibitor I42 family protein n=1 Tax=Brevibacillus sp. GCM10020057 TaxID=3317327 RepID=UPI0036349DB9
MRKDEAFVADSTTRSMRVTSGQTFTLTMDANPTTGYQWFLSNPLDGRFLKLISNDYLPPAAPRAGQGGHQVLTFHALQPGMTSIALKYCRPWENADCVHFLFAIVTIE